MAEKFKNSEINEPEDDQDISDTEETESSIGYSEKIIKALVDGNVNRAVKLSERSEKEGFNSDSEEIKKAALDLIRRCLSTTQFERIKEKFSLPDEEYYDAVTDGIKELPHHIILGYNWRRILPEEYISRAMEKYIVKIFTNGHPYLAQSIVDKYNIAEEVVQYAAEEGIVAQLSQGYLRPALDIQKKFKLQEDIYKRKIFIEAAKEGILKCLSSSKFYEADQFKKYFDIPEGFYKQEAVVESAKAGVKIEISSSKGSVDTVAETMKKFGLKQKLIKSKEFVRSASDGVWRKLSDGQIEDAIKIINFCPDVEKNVAEIDEHIAENLSADKYDLSGILLKFIPFLGRQDIRKLFPETFGKIVLLLNDNLEKDENLADYFLENLDKYYKNPWVGESLLKAVTHYSVTAKFLNMSMEAGKSMPWEKETWYDAVCEKANEIAEEHKTEQSNDWQSDDYSRGGESEGFSESDPHDNHLWKVDPDKIKLACAIDKLLDGNYNDDELEKLGINIAELEPFLNEINRKITEAHYNFLDNAGRSGKISDEDMKSFTDSEHPFYPENSLTLTMLTNNVRGFVSRYLIGLVNGDKDKLVELTHDPKKFISEFKQRNIKIVEDEIKSLSVFYALNEDKIQKREEQIEHINDMYDDIYAVINEGFNKYIKVLEVDVPLYDKLYEEFDNLRETGRNPLEVYLGRDGIYAYVGRRAQDLARRRKLGLKGRKAQKEMGEVVEINPKYLVYPRYFRDNINYDTKKQFLQQEEVSPDLDPIFYDTGYTGTIPEQIIRIILTEVGWEQKDINDEVEKRIRLLSAPSVHRRVKGIPENARHEIVEYIEHNAKTEETAEGLIIDKKTGKIRHISKPTNPEEQFYYAMVKQAVARHYWLKERLHHEPSGNVNLDSEHYTIRIRQDYAKLLPQEFLKDPKTFFAEHGELLKGSKGEGQYPDEEIILFKMEDGIEVVAKKIELRKAKESRKEFSILISAKKAGLPTAEPVGFLTGKEEKDGSYLLMKKIEGYSGRNFDKYLQGLGKFTAEQIKDIMKVITDKNKEIAKLFRQTLKIDKRWRIKDTIIEFNEETGEVGDVIPIDWERAKDYDESNPQKIDEIE